MFALARAIPSDPCKATLGERATKAVCDDFNRRNGLDRPILVQLGKYLNQLLHGDFGRSFQLRRPITTLITERLPTTIELAVVALVFAVVVGIPLGVIAARRRNSLLDAGTMVIANAGISVPVFVLGLALQYVFAVMLKGTFLALPPSGRLSAGLIPKPFYEQWGLPKNGVLDFISNHEMLNGLLQWNWRGPWWTPPNTSCCPPSPLAPSRWPSSPE